MALTVAGNKERERKKVDKGLYSHARPQSLPAVNLEPEKSADKNLLSRSYFFDS